MGTSTMPKCKCADCGLVAIHDIHRHGLHEVDEQARKTGVVATDRYRRAICIVRAFPIGEEQIDTSELEFRKVLSDERDCKQFYPWQQGNTPKEHRQMMLHERFLEKQDAKIKQQREDDLRFQEERRRSDRQWQEEFQNRMKRKETIRQVWMAVFTSILTLVGAIILYWLNIKKP